MFVYFREIVKGELVKNKFEHTKSQNLFISVDNKLKHDNAEEIFPGRFETSGRSYETRSSGRQSVKDS